jgi:hypothetical protein
MWAAGPNQETNLFLSNTTDHTLTVSVFFYQQDGSSPPSSYIAYLNFINSNTQIAAGSSAAITIQTLDAFHFGYAVINWKNSGTDNDLFGLVGSAQRQQEITGTSYWGHYIPLNNGLPF